MKRAIRIHRVDFIAIVALVIGAVVVSGYILLHQPAFTLLKSYYVVNVPFSTAAAVTAGQGQTVDIAGVPVGQVGGVNLRNGHAVVAMDIYKQYAPIYRDATVLLRPPDPAEGHVPGARPRRSELRSGAQRRLPERGGHASGH